MLVTNATGRDYLVDLNADGRLKIKCISNNRGVLLWTGFVWFRGEPLPNWLMRFVSIKGKEFHGQLRAVSVSSWALLHGVGAAFRPVQQNDSGFHENKLIYGQAWSPESSVGIATSYGLDADATGFDSRLG
jgi:hypothetical protein